LVGLGAIGRSLVGQLSSPFSLGGALTRETHAAEAEQLLPPDTPLCTEIAELLALELDIVVECAGQEAVRAYSQAVVESGRDLLIVSTGALADDRLRDSLLTTRPDRGRLIVVPGAIAGLDGLGALEAGALHSVTYTSIKPAAAWKNTQAEAIVELDQLHAPTEFFLGSAREAAQRYPKNANVAATIALSGVGFDDTRVRLIADPDAVENIGRIEARGDLGDLDVTFKGPASPTNPKTSAVTASSILFTLHKLAAGALP
jgi:aspartate dehydrogenase